MKYTVRVGDADSGSLRVLARDAEEALSIGMEMASKGMGNITVTSEGGTTDNMSQFSRQLRGHSLNVDQFALIQSTCDVLLSADSRVAEVFYERLFAIAPEVRIMFPANLAEQQRKLLNTLIALVSQMTHPDLFKGQLTSLGKSHVSYGTKPEHYTAVGQALIAALRALLADRFTGQVEAAWTILYADIAASMIAASSRPRRSAVVVGDMP